jgi:glycosyltransferase involved in cell wall biosynthesis
MIVRNESENLVRCLQSAKPFVDEIIVVDTGSIDNTVSIAEQFGAEIHNFIWLEDFSAARNTALDAANGEWILVLDADEELITGAATLEMFKTFLQDCQVDGIELMVRNRMPSGDIMKFQDFYLTRLFRNKPGYRYRGIIHEQIRPAIEENGGSIGRLEDVYILHHGYAQQTVQGSQSRLRRNMALLELSLVENPNDAYLHYHLGNSFKDLGNFEKASEHLYKALENVAQLTENIRENLYVKLSQLALAKDDIRSAAELARQCLEINPHNLIGLYVGSLALIYSGDYASALEGFSAIMAHPNINPEELPQIRQIEEFCRQKVGEMTHS